jgi:hypothetical protein
MSQDVGKLRCQIAQVPLYMYMYNKKTHSSSNLGKEVVKQERLWWQSHASWIYLCSMEETRVSEEHY